MEGEIVGAFGGLVGRFGRDDAVDAEGPLSLFGSGDQVPDVVLVNQALRVDEPLGLFPGAAGVGQADFPPANHGGLQQIDHCWPMAVTLAPPGGVDQCRVGGGLVTGSEVVRRWLPLTTLMRGRFAS